MHTSSSPTASTAAIFTYLALGCGLQSSTIAEMIAEGALPKVEAAIFADTGDEPHYVYRQRDYLQKRLGTVEVPVVTVSAGNIVKDLQSPDKRFAALPVFTRQADGKIGRLQRQCTREYKIEPIERWIRGELLRRGFAKRNRRGAIYVNRGIRAEAWLGITLDEVERLKPNRTSWIANRWPLIERRMYRHDCVRWLKERGLPLPRKSSCRVCPFHNDDHWREMRRERLDDWRHALAFDTQLRDGSLRLTAAARGELFLHRSCVPLRQVDLRSWKDSGQSDFFDICDDGYCGV